MQVPIYHDRCQKLIAILNLLAAESDDYLTRLLEDLEEHAPPQPILRFLNRHENGCRAGK
ncbi:MAG: hypothetical protein AMXMBFR13_36430 [Phycisphaerae bacterium]